MSRSAISITPNVIALMKKQASTPSSAMSPPAAAGPRMRDECTTTELSATALTTRSAPTISLTNAWRAGLSMARTVPRTSTSPKTIHASTAPPAASAQSASAGIAISVCVIVSSRRLSSRSASTPPQLPSSRIGRNCRPAVMPTAAPLPVSSTISHISATICIQLPEMETTWPAK
jgi:hypothetical protein